MALVKTVDDSKLTIGTAHLFFSTNAGQASGAGWRYLGKTGERTTITRGEQHFGVELDESQGALLGDWASAPHGSISTALTVLTRQNLADTRPGSTPFLVTSTLVAVGIGRANTQNITANLPSFCLIPEWCNMSAMALDVMHPDWKSVFFIWRGIVVDQGAISYSLGNVATAPIRIVACMASTAAGMTAQLPDGYRLYYGGNPKAAPAGHPILTVGTPMTMPDFQTLVTAFQPNDFVVEELDAWLGDPFTTGGMKHFGRLTGARSFTFATTTRPITHPQYGDTPVGALVVGASAGAELTALQLDLDLYYMLLDKSNRVQNPVNTTVGLGVGDVGFNKIPARALLLRPISATDGSRDFWLPHAILEGKLDEDFHRARRNLPLKFVGRMTQDARWPAGAKVAMYGDAAAAGVALQL